MTFASRTSPFFAITVAGNAVAFDQVSFTDGVAPEVGNASFRVLLGTRLVGGSVVTTDPTTINTRDLVVITLGSTVWRGYVGTTDEIAQASEDGAVGGRMLQVLAYGIGADLDRAYLTTSRRVSHLTGNAVSVPFDMDFNAGNKPNRSASTFTVGSGTAYIFEDNYAVAGKWTQAQALQFLLMLGDGEERESP